MILKNSFLYLAGIAFLTLSKLRNTLQGYKCPKPFDISETERCIAYDIRDRTDRSLMLAWPLAIRPIVSVEHLLLPPFLAPLTLRLSRVLEQTPPPWDGCAPLGFWHG